MNTSNKSNIKNFFINYTSLPLFLLGFLLGIFLIYCHMQPDSSFFYSIAEYTQFLVIWFFIVCLMPLISKSALHTLNNSISFFVTFVLSYYIFQYILTGDIEGTHLIIYWLIASVACTLYALLLKIFENKPILNSLLFSISISQILFNIYYLLTHKPFNPIYLLFSILFLLALSYLYNRYSKINKVVVLISSIILAILYLLLIGQPLTHFI